MSAAIRPAHLSDVDRLLEIEQASFAGDRLSRRAFRFLVASPTACVLAAEVSGVLAGYAIVLFRGTSRVARLYSLASRFPGIGRRLLEAAEMEALRRGRSAMRLEVRTDNDHAIRLYERAGYRRLELRPDYYQDGMAALRMQKGLCMAATGTAGP